MEPLHDLLLVNDMIKKCDINSSNDFSEVELIAPQGSRRNFLCTEKAIKNGDDNFFEKFAKVLSNCFNFLFMCQSSRCNISPNFFGTSMMG